ncbi:MAG: aminotransferase class I/II-fold pyridoxal phosphate-dependent enzyme [Magnetococcales bacterium]|nr:aminotransferase class I/II-fold pyridoxal phosphate-dependent enzyme [Magnetococcales bacterium]
MIPLAIPDLSGNESRYLQECIDSTFISSVGPFVTRFEAAVASACGASRAVATASGTSGLHAALTALGVGRGELVITPSFTFIATANAIAHCGADPWLFDMEPGSWTLDPVQVEESLEWEAEERPEGVFHQKTGRRVAAILPVYTLGTPAAMDRLARLARRYRLPLLADAAAALGATFLGDPVGKLGADLTVFSFNGNKTVTCGGGGAVAGQDAETVDLVRHLTTTARRGADYTHDRVGFNYRMTALQAAVGCAQLERLEHLVGAKRRIRARYDAAFADHPRLSLFPQPPDRESACWLSGVVVYDADSEAMAALRQQLLQEEIDVRPFWKPVHLQQPFAHAPQAALPVTDGVWGHVLTLPCSAALTQEDQERVILAVQRALERGAGAA